jgi:tryptophanyl-tRNA synthetase
MKSILSGIQSSGNLTLGNYLGAIKNWVELSKSPDYEINFFVADLHSITVRQDPILLRKRSIEIYKIFLASGIDLDTHNIFFQSHVHQHAELAWVLNCYTQLGELNRMTQFKDKTAKQSATNINAGLYTYPVLMASDILLYQADLVPVGEDQRQHLEICRDIAARFNNIYGEAFKLPDGYIPKSGSRIMSLSDPTKKMSKSDENPNGYILMLEDSDTIAKKIKKSVTDSLGEVRYDDTNPEKAGVNNLLSIYCGTTGKTIEEAEKEFDGANYGSFKGAVAEVVIDTLRPIQEKLNDYDEEYVMAQARKSAAKASIIADKTLKDVYDKIGFVPS